MGLIESFSGFYLQYPATPATDVSFPARIATITQPAMSATTGVIDLGAPNGDRTRNGLSIVPVGQGSATNTFSMRVWHWRDIIGNNSASPLKTLWVPVLLAEVLCTLGTGAGVAGSPLTSTYLFATSLSLTFGNSNVSIELFSPGSNLPAHFDIDVKGARKIELTYQMSGSATNGAALVAGL